MINYYKQVMSGDGDLEQEHPPASSQSNLHRRFRISIAILSVVICSLNIRQTNVDSLRESRDLHRSINKAVLLHDDLSIYWFGYRDGQYLINYPIQEYYLLPEFGLFGERMLAVLGNFQQYTFGVVDQGSLNATRQTISAAYRDGRYEKYEWSIAEGITQPFDFNNTQSIRTAFLNCLTMEIAVRDLTIERVGPSEHYISRWDIQFIVQPFSETTIQVTVAMQEKLYLGFRHIPHFLLGICTFVLIAVELRNRESSRRHRSTNYDSPYSYRYLVRKFRGEDMPDFLVAFFLVYSSVSSFTGIFTLSYVFLLDGITCFIAWLYILKLYTENDEYHLSIVIKKSYILVARLFISFGPLFLGACLFALTAFCRYSNLFDSFHKSFVSLFTICYYNMTYEEYRTTERANPISTIFFTALIMIFTICTYSGMLVAVFCSFMWNRREKKNKEELLEALKIECPCCNKKYAYAEGYQASVRHSAQKKQSELENEQDSAQIGYQLKREMRFRTDYYTQKMLAIIHNNEQICRGLAEEGAGEATQRQCGQMLEQALHRIEQLLSDI